MNFFNVFGINQPHFFIDLKDLKKTYIELQKQSHPDRFASASEHEQNAALLKSSLINDAFEVLSDDLKRAKYILECKEIPLSNATRNEFLIEQMELEESLEENNNNLQELKLLLDKTNIKFNENLDTLRNHFEAGNFDSISSMVNELVFLQKFTLKIKDRINKII